MRTQPTNEDADYILNTFAPQHMQPWFIAAHKAGEAKRAGMQVSALEGALLRFLVQMQRPQTLLELGTFMGYSTLWMASGVCKGAVLHTIEADAEHIEMASGHIAASPYAEQVRMHHGKALEVLPQLLPQLPLVDMVFIDAVKSEYSEYLDLLEPYLSPGALVVGDNTLLFGAMAGQARKKVSQSAVQSMQAFNARLAEATYYDSILLPTEEGLSIGRWRG